MHNLCILLINRFIFPFVYWFTPIFIVFAAIIVLWVLVESLINMIKEKDKPSK